ncbi:copper-binding protein [Limnobacter sp. P1]|jgi:Cu/Ag efflux protein CusF|uniref:copper-binding protein n=1 Tax=Limnobacter olei TaxID=3031298 RepID=UPI0023AFA7EA|nr:copper-binding protein [Limnobacter sp. P1]
MKNTMSTLLAALAIVASSSAFAGGDHGTHAGNAGVEKAADMNMQANADMTQGEIKKIDSKNGKVTLKHGEIKNLQMPPMTMVFTAKDKAQLEGLSKGDNVMFSVDKDMNLTHIQKQ